MGEPVPREHDDSKYPGVGTGWTLNLRIADGCQASDQAFRDDATAAAPWHAIASLKHECPLISTTDTLQALNSLLLRSWVLGHTT